VSVAAESLLHEIAVERNVAKVVERHARRGERLPGIGHPIYPDGDPRADRTARAARALRRRSAPHAGRRRPPRGRARRAAFRRPTSISASPRSRTCSASRAAPGELVFALARMAGWIAHALEEYARPSSIRPRAVYTGLRPETGAS
jgi:citrate synthase